MKGVVYQEYAKIEPSDFMNFVQSIRYETILKNKHSSSEMSRRKSTFSNVVYGVFNAADSTRDADSEASGRFGKKIYVLHFNGKTLSLHRLQERARTRIKALAVVLNDTCRTDNRLEFHEFQTTIVFLAFEGFLKGDYSRYIYIW